MTLRHALRYVSLNLRIDLRRAVDSARLASARRHQKIAAQIVADRGELRLREVVRKYRFSSEPGQAPVKYLHVHHHLERSLQRASVLGLLDSPPRRVLDLGCGGGFFLAATRYFGHESTGVDLDEIPVYNELIPWFGVPRVIHRITPFAPLPDSLAGPFDLVTSFQCCFNRRSSLEPWGVEEWSFFLSDITNRLSEIGIVKIELNRNRRSGEYLPVHVSSKMAELPGVWVAPDRSVLLARRHVHVGDGPLTPRGGRNQTTV